MISKSNGFLIIDNCCVRTELVNSFNTELYSFRITEDTFKPQAYKYDVTVEYGYTYLNSLYIHDDNGTSTDFTDELGKTMLRILNGHELELVFDIRVLFDVKDCNPHSEYSVVESVKRTLKISESLTDMNDEIHKMSMEAHNEVRQNVLNQFSSLNIPPKMSMVS